MKDINLSPVKVLQHTLVFPCNITDHGKLYLPVSTEEALGANLLTHSNSRLGEMGMKKSLVVLSE